MNLSSTTTNIESNNAPMSNVAVKTASNLAQNNLVQPAQDSSQQSLQSVEESIRLIDDLKFFLATAPANWQENQIIRRYYLNHDEGFVSCVFWNNLYFVTGTDIVKCLIYRFEQFGRTITDRKKFEEGIFSDLRNLKCGTDAILEPPKSKFLEFLYKNSCLRTQKKQKVFFWFSVQHDKLFADALERDLKREMVDQKTTTKAEREPALSFKYNDSKSLYEQLTSHMEDKKKALGFFSNNNNNTGAPAPGNTNPQIPGNFPFDPENPYAYLQYNNQIPQQQNPHLLPQQIQPQPQPQQQPLYPFNPAFAANNAAAYAPVNPAVPAGNILGPDVDDAGNGADAEYAGTDDDFPLDFFPQNEYINETIDPSQAFVNNNVPLFDPNIFLNPSLIGGVSVMPNFDDFLIDQASPFSPGPQHLQDLQDKTKTENTSFSEKPVENNETENDNEGQTDDSNNANTNKNANTTTSTITTNNANTSNNINSSTTAPPENPLGNLYDQSIFGANAGIDFANPLNPAAALYPQMNPQLVLAAQAQAGLVPAAGNPSLLGLGGAPTDYLLNPYLAAANADPSIYYEHMAALQAQQQMMGMMNPEFLVPGLNPVAHAGIPAPNALNQLQRQKLLQQQQSSSSRFNRLKNARQQQLSLNNGRVSKSTSNLNQSFVKSESSESIASANGNDNGNSNGQQNSQSESTLKNGNSTTNEEPLVKEEISASELNDVLNNDPGDDDGLIASIKHELAGK